MGGNYVDEVDDIPVADYAERVVTDEDDTQGHDDDDE
jgi:hypothetical protein